MAWEWYMLMGLGIFSLAFGYIDSTGKKLENNARKPVESRRSDRNDGSTKSRDRTGSRHVDVRITPFTAFYSCPDCGTFDAHPIEHVGRSKIIRMCNVCELIVKQEK